MVVGVSFSCKNLTKFNESADDSKKHIFSIFSTFSHCLEKYEVYQMRPIENHHNEDNLPSTAATV